jgi:hypothetical protein
LPTFVIFKKIKIGLFDQLPICVVCVSPISLLGNGWVTRQNICAAVNASSNRRIVDALFSGWSMLCQRKVYDQFGPELLVKCCFTS